MLSCPNIDRTQYVTETVQCRFTTNSIIGFGREESIFHTKFYLPIRITLSRHRPRHLKLKILGHVRLSCQIWLATTYGVVSASCLFSRGVLPCRASPCHVPSNNITVVIRKAPPRSRRPATWRETQVIQFDSGTVPHQLENNSPIILRATHGFPPGNKTTQKEQNKLHNNSATPTAYTTLQSDIRCNNQRMLYTTTEHTSEPLPSQLLRELWRRRLPLCFSEDRVW